RRHSRNERQALPLRYVPEDRARSARGGEGGRMTKRFVTTKVEVEGREETKIVELPSREPSPWNDDANLHIVGQRIVRMDALEKVTGAARYTADVQLPRMLYAAILRAPVARGRVSTPDLSPALAMDGVRGCV